MKIEGGAYPGQHDAREQVPVVNDPLFLARLPESHENDIGFCRLNRIDRFSVSLRGRRRVSARIGSRNSNSRESLGEGVAQYFDDLFPSAEQIETVAKASGLAAKGQHEIRSVDAWLFPDSK